MLPSVLSRWNLFTYTDHFRFFPQCRLNLSVIKFFRTDCSKLHNQRNELSDTIEYEIDARERVLSEYSKVNECIVDREVENCLLFNSVINSFRERLPLKERLKKYTRLSKIQRNEKHHKELTEEVDSIAASIIKKSSITTNLLKEQDTNQSDIQSTLAPDEEQIVFPYSHFTPIDQKIQKWKRSHNMRGKKLIREEDINYGKPNPSIPISKVPCGGCGALLHCQAPSAPGYLPSEIFCACNKHDLRGQICQRCRFLREHDVALNVSVKPEDYPKIISAVKDTYALVVLIIDLLDFPCSIWPGLLDIIGNKRPVHVVGNKVDLLPRDSRGYLDHIKSCLIRELEKSGMNRANIKHVALASATTGYGVEQIINKIQHDWGTKGDVYLLGCTNVGKSSLFNALIGSDFCKVQAIDLLERATVSAWPGTTLNMLKFPMMRPSSLRLYQRTLRLKAESKVLAMEENMRLQKLKETGDSKYATLIGHIGRTFFVRKENEIDSSDPFIVNTNKVSGEDASFFNPEHECFVASKWCHDTPGTVNHDQILTLLTLEELMIVLPKKIIKPRTLLLLPGSTYFLAGLARIDFLEGSHPLLLTTFSSGRLPLTVLKQEDADEVYRKLLGTPLLAVPCGSEQRLMRWPSLESKDVTIEGIGDNESAADIVLSSAGWVAITGRKGAVFKLRVYTPEARGVHVRNPSLLPYAVRLRGKRIGKTPVFENKRIFCNKN